MDSSSGVAPRRGWYHGWNIVAVSILAQIAGVGLSVNAFSLFLKDWSADLNTPISTFQISLMATAFGSAIFSPFFGAAADRYPARWLFGGGLLLLAVFHLLVSVATAPWQIIVLFGILLPLGLAAGTGLVANAVVSRWFVRRRGLALGLTAFGLGMAGVILPPIIASVPHDVGWRVIWRVAGLATGVVILPIVLFVVRDRPTDRDGLSYLDGVAQAAGGHHGGGGKSGLRTMDVLKRRNFWLIMGVFLPIMAAYGAVSQNLAPIAASHGFSKQAAGAMISALGMAHIVATLGFGLLSDRFGNSRPFSALALMVAGAALLVAFGQSLPVVAVGAALIGLAGGTYTLQAASIAAEFGDGFGRAFGLSMCVIPLTALGPFVTAKTQEITGSYTPALVGFALACVVGAGIILLMKERRADKADTAAAPARAAAAE